MRRIKNVTAFYSEWDMFSNFYACELLIKGIVFNCSEQAYMYTKAKYFQDHDIAREIMKAEYPSAQKRLGRQVRGFDKTVWRKVDIKVMSVIVGKKLEQHPVIRHALLGTDSTVIVEASKRDLHWGSGIAMENPKIADPDSWPGENNLGKIFMKYRDYYQNLNHQ